MIKLDRIRTNGDSSSEYNLVFCERTTLQDFIEYVISNKENRGRVFFEITDTDGYKSGSIRYANGEIDKEESLYVIGFGFLTMPCVEGTANGGWGMMDYHVILTSNYSYTPTKESKKASESMSESTRRHEKICRDLNRLYEKKNHDYGDSFHKSFAEWGLPMACIRLGDKYNRLCNLIKNGGAEVEDESIRDTLMDLANYTIMTLMELDKEEEK